MNFEPLEDLFYFKFNFYPLHRQLLYTEKQNLEDFGLPENVQDKLYELYVTTKGPAIGDRYSVVEVFNEVFYLLTCIYADKSAAEHVGQYLSRDLHIFPKKEPQNDPVSGYPVYDNEYDDQRHYARLYVLTFVWLILKIHPNLPKHVRFFLVALEKQINDQNPYYDQFMPFLKGQSLKIDISLEPCPDLSGLTSKVTTEDWVEETKDFDREIITEIVHRFKDIQGRKMLISEIRNALHNSTPKEDLYRIISAETGGKKANDAFLDVLLQEAIGEETQRQEQKEKEEKTKDERIVELENQIKTLINEKREAIRDKEDAERERDKYRKKWEELNSRLNKKYIPAELKSDEAKLIIEELIKQDLITPLGHNTGIEFVIQTYRWDGTGALFGYFVDKMNFQLELADSGGRINWKPFKHAFSNYEEKEKRARDTVSYYKQHPDTKMPENAEKIDNAIAIAEEKLANK